ncbi:unnamed protein product [Rotaria sp. Silwood1]|nr:unnamed protein product [Rotaria sp. Silwood1]CAF1259423.1 unnamed protein product [Rotaria sp. Silwood1]CAF1612751.1 unnamed protein product [Rotaria sp. Silwood1]CAF1613196.1 unnamed protein product [Rotaria sp. Silwood1]CAF3839456.1 unnamed protein product [Rotaria sp. Silwood1]
MPFCNPCLRPADSSILTYTKHSSSISIKNLLRRQLFKKFSTITKCQSSFHSTINKQEINHKFKRIKGSNIIREIKINSKNNQTLDLISNYDMTVNHDDELDDTQIALSHRQSKKIPRWARKSQLQLAIINQIYYNDKNPEDIFGSIHLDFAHEIINSIELWNTELPFGYTYETLPPNFV